MLYNKHRVNWLLSVVSGMKMRMFTFFVFELVSIISLLGFVYYSKVSVDLAVKNPNQTIFFKTVILVVFCCLLSVFFKSLSLRSSQIIQVNLSSTLQSRLLLKQMKSVWSVMKKWNTGDVLVRLNSDVNEVIQMISITWINLILTIFKLVLSFSFLYTLDPKLALIILIISPLFGLSKFYYNKLKKLNRETKKAESMVGAIMYENLKLRVLIKSLGLFNLRSNEFEKCQSAYKSLRLSSLSYSLIMQTVLKFSINIGYLIVFVWGIYRLNKQEITFGTMTAFLQLVNHIQGPILSIVSFLPAFIRFNVSAERVYEIDNLEISPNIDQEKVDDIKSIIFDNVSFGYDESRIINSLDFKIDKGESVSIVGKSGKGKATFVRLLLSLVKPNSGNIYFINSSGQKILITQSHNINFSYVPQGNTLFSGSIRDNILLNNETYNEQQINNALYLSCSEFVNDLPDGLETIIGESGIGLSEGQAQRIAIARAILKNGSILLLDEPTSALDSDTTNKLMSRLFLYKKDKILILITHDKKLSEMCNQTVFIN